MYDDLQRLTKSELVSILQEETPPGFEVRYMMVCAKAHLISLIQQIRSYKETGVWVDMEKYKPWIRKVS